MRTLLSTGVDIKFGKEASRIEESDTEGVTVFFTDGTSAKGDVLVGADGTHSAVRPHVLKKPNEEVLVQFPATIIAGEVKLSGKEMEEQLRLGHSAIMNIQADGILFSGVNKVTVSEETGETTGDYYWVLSVMDPTVDQPGHWTKTSSQEEKLRFAKEKVSVLDEKRRVTVDSTEVGGLKAYSVSRLLAITYLNENLGLTKLLVLVGNRDQRAASCQQGGAYRRRGTRHDAKYVSPPVVDLMLHH